MNAFTNERHIEWGDCDAAGIVFYPNYFSWMDATFHALTRTIGFDQRRLIEEHQLAGTPLVHADCAFRAPARYHDTLTIKSTVRKLSGSTVSLAYSFEVDGRVVAEGSETRVCVRTKTGGMEKAELPSDLRRGLERYL